MDSGHFCVLSSISLGNKNPKIHIFSSFSGVQSVSILDTKKMPTKITVTDCYIAS